MGPLLDTIETSLPSPKPCNPLCIKGIGDFDGENLYISEVSHYKALSVKLAAKLDSINDPLWRERGGKIACCGTAVIMDASLTRVLGADFCRLRCCPQCQRRRSLRVAVEFRKIQDSLPSHAWLHMVLTVPNVGEGELSIVIKLLFKASSRFFRLGTVMRAFDGIARCLEVTFSKSRGDYHPHLHCLIAVKPSYFTSRYYLKRETIAELWTGIYKLAEEGYPVDRWNDEKLLRRIERGGDLFQIWVSKADDRAVSEVAKYCVKPLDSCGDLHAFFHIYDALHGVRLIQTYGVVRSAAKLNKLADLCDDEPPGDCAGPGRLFRWNGRSYDDKGQVDLTFLGKLNQGWGSAFAD